MGPVADFTGMLFYFIYLFAPIKLVVLLYVLGHEHVYLVIIWLNSGFSPHYCFDVGSVGQDKSFTGGEL